VFVVAAWFRLDGVAFCSLQNKFLDWCSYFFLFCKVFIFFVAVGSDKIQKLLHFPVAVGLCFFQLQF